MSAQLWRIPLCWRPELAGSQVLPQASVSLEQALQASAREGRLISAKFELEDSALQLSGYTAKGNRLEEVVIDHKTGSIKKAEAITKDGDLKEAKEQSLAMAKAKTTLEQAVQNALKNNVGYRAVSVEPHLSGGQAVAFVACALDGAMKIFDGSTFQVLATAKFAGRHSSRRAFIATGFTFSSLPHPS